MKIAYCIHSTYNSGGMERIVLNKANHLAEKGYDITIITTEQKGRMTFFPLNKKIKMFDLNINYSDDEKVGFFHKFISFIKKKRIHKKCLRQLLLKNKYDIVISTFGNEVTMLPLIKDGSKKIVELHFSKYFRLQLAREGIWRLVDKYRTYQDQCVIKKYDKFVSLTNEDRLFWKCDNVVVIPNFISEYSLDRASLKNKQVIAVGRLSYQKGYDRLIDAWKIVSEECRDWNLRIYGSGELKDELIKQIVDNGLNDCVSICPPTTSIMKDYLNSSIFVLTSHYEGLPMVLLEAASCGLPVVSFSCKCGPKDIIENGYNGFLIQEGNIEEFAFNLLKLINNLELRLCMGKNNYITSLKYTEDAIMKKWINLFEELTH